MHIILCGVFGMQTEVGRSKAGGRDKGGSKRARGKEIKAVSVQGMHGNNMTLVVEEIIHRVATKMLQDFTH